MVRPATARRSPPPWRPTRPAGQRLRQPGPTRGFVECTGARVVVPDRDERLVEGGFRTRRRFACSPPGTGVVFGRMRLVDEHDAVRGQLGFGKVRSAVEAFLGGRGIVPPSIAMFRRGSVRRKAPSIRPGGDSGIRPRPPRSERSVRTDIATSSPSPIAATEMTFPGGATSLRPSGNCLLISSRSRGRPRFRPDWMRSRSTIAAGTDDAGDRWVAGASVPPSADDRGPRSSRRRGPRDP